MPTKKNVSLAEFIKQFEKPSCIVCILPERNEIDAAFLTGSANRRNILRWLWEAKGYGDKSLYDEKGQPTGISATALDKHLTGQHHFSKEEV
jgi:hypothetical protein